MSYSLQVRAATKAAALVELAKAFDNAVSGQIHAKDKVAALAIANAVTNTLADVDDQDVVINVNGSMSWNGVLADGEQPTVTACNASANAYLVAR